MASWRAAIGSAFVAALQETMGIVPPLCSARFYSLLSDSRTKHLPVFGLLFVSIFQRDVRQVAFLIRVRIRDRQVKIISNKIMLYFFYNYLREV